MKRPDPIKGIKGFVSKRRKSAIKEVIKEVTSGGIVYRHNKRGEIEVLLVQDARDRWTIPKGHIEEGESPRQTAKREVNEETGLALADIDVQEWLGKNNFQYRRVDSLVLMKMHVFLIHATGNTDALQKEEWMKGIRWFKADKALDKIEYENISKLLLLGLKKIREKHS